MNMRKVELVWGDDIAAALDAAEGADIELVEGDDALAAMAAVVATARPEEKLSVLDNTTLGRAADEVCSYSGRVFDGGPNCYPAAPFYVELPSGMRHFFASENMARRSQYWSGS